MRLRNAGVGPTTTLSLLLLLISSLTGSALLVSPPLSQLQRQSPIDDLTKGTCTNCFENNLRRSAHSATTSSISFAVLSGRLSIPTSTIGLIRRYAAPNDDTEEEMRSRSSGEGDTSSDDENSSPNDPFARINSFLDTPILDPNNIKDQGPVLETLKEFVKNDPEFAQLTFQGILILGFLVCVRLFNTVKYGQEG